jgi:hypothetical protein
MGPAILLALAAVVPPGALLDQPGDAATMARAERHSELPRSVAEYAVSLAALTGTLALAFPLLSQGHVTVSHGNVTVDGSHAALAGAGAFIAVSPFVSALGSWLVGKGSSEWDPSLGWATLGAYGSSLLAVAGGMGLAAANVDRSTAVVVDTALYLAVPLGTVLLQNATRQPRPLP